MAVSIVPTYPSRGVERTGGERKIRSPRGDGSDERGLGQGEDSEPRKPNHENTKGRKHEKDISRKDAKAQRGKGNQEPERAEVTVLGHPVFLCFFAPLRLCVKCLFRVFVLS